SIRRVTATEFNEYHPRWSPDGKMLAFEATRRGLTDRETTMEDTHAWVVNADGTGRREIGVVDNRQGPPEWSPDGRGLLFSVQSRGTVGLFRVPLTCAANPQPCPAEKIIGQRGTVGAYLMSKTVLDYAHAAPGDQAEHNVGGQ